ncbi:hypothetical protein V3C99_013226, partial [Haemonchus contortus]
FLLNACRRHSVGVHCRHFKNKKSSALTWPSYGLCPYQPHPGNKKMLFSTAVDEDCNDENSTTRFVPCLFSGGFSCIMAFVGFDNVISGCIRDGGERLVTFETSPNNSEVRNVATIDGIAIYNSCSARERTCAPSEVLYEGTSAIYLTCCCKGYKCTNMESYRDDDTISEGDVIPFSDSFHLYILAFCYGTTTAALTIIASLTLYKAYTNRLILKNQ